MKKILSGLLLLGSYTAAFAVETSLQTKVESVTLYHSGALVTRTSSESLNQGLNELVFENLSSKIILNSLKVANKEITVLNKSVIRKLTSEEYNQLLDKKDALTKQMSLIESKYSAAGFVTKVEDLEKMTAFYADKMQQVKRDLREVERKIEEAKKLEKIELKNDNAAILKLVVSLDGKMKTPFKMQYVCGGIGWSPSYEITVGNASEKTIEVKYLAKTMSQTGEDWDNVTINLSSSFPLESPTDLPKPKTPWVLEGRGFNYNNANQNDQVQQVQEQQKIDKLEGVEYQEISIPSFLKLRTIKDKYSVKSNNTVFTFPVQSVVLPADYHYYGYPGIDPEVYLVARVTGWDTLGFVDGIASISFAGNEVGKSVIKFSESRDTLILPVGKDNSVFMKRSEMTDQKYFKTSNSGKKRYYTYAYKFELKNNNSFPVHFELLDQIPVSQTKNAEVEVEKKSDGNIDTESGDITWEIQLKPGGSVDKELIFTVEMDGSYRYSASPKKHKYRTISAPSF